MAKPKAAAKTVDIPLADGRTETVLAKHVGSMWWAMDKETGVHHTMVSVSNGPRRDVYTTALPWAETVLRTWGEWKREEVKG